MTEQTEFKQSFQTRLREGLGLAVYNTGHQRCAPSYTWGPGVRDHYLIHYVVSGCGVLMINGKQHRVCAGDAFLITPDLLACYTASDKNPWEYLWVGFHGSDSQHLLRLTAFSPQSPVVHFSDQEQMRSLLMCIVNAQGGTAHQEARMCGNLYLLLAYLIEYAKKPPQEAEVAYSYAELALRYIERNYAGHITVDDIAAHVGISRSHLYRVFVKHMSLSPNEYVARFRVAKACALLSSPLSVSEVAGSVGFEDPLYFSRVFRRLKGLSPLAYRKERRLEPQE